VHTTAQRLCKPRARWLQLHNRSCCVERWVWIVLWCGNPRRPLRTVVDVPVPSRQRRGAILYTRYSNN
jgi:hypothetical protein